MADQSTAQGERVVRLAAAGDLLFTAPTPHHPSERDAAAALRPLHSLLADCHIVLGNLECTLPGQEGTVPTEPRVLATQAQVRGVASAGVTIVTLANNHMFDGLQDGFHRLRALLAELGVAHFGAGDDEPQACAPAIVQAGGLRVAFLACVDAATGPSQLAGVGQCGVAPLDIDRLIRQVSELRRQVDCVVVSLHWGQERFRIPSPLQVEQAHALAEAGATLVLGHHPHVLQGMETYRGVPIAYSLGNCAACEVPYESGDLLGWNREERTGCVLVAELRPGQARILRRVPTYDDGQSVAADATGFGERLIARADRAIARGITDRRFRRETFRVRTLKPVLAHLRWSYLKTLRVRKVWGILGEAKRRGSEA